MNGRAHALAGAATVSPVVTIEGRVTLGSVVLIGVGALAALAPDLDHPTGSLAINRLGRVGRILSTVLRSLSAIARQASGTRDDREAWDFFQNRARIRRDPDHRALTHTLAAAIVAGVVAWAAIEPFDVFDGPLGGVALGGAVFAGWASSVLMDAMTVQGVPLLWPIAITSRTNGRARRRRWHPVRLGRLESGAPSDWWVAWAWTLAFAGPTFYLSFWA